VLKVGDSVLASVDAGLQAAEGGVLLISPAFLQKEWPTYETTVLLRDHIERRKKVFPVWHNVDADEVRKHWPGLANVFAVSTSAGMDRVIQELVRAFVPRAGTVAVPPLYEDPVSRFFRGHGELTLGNEGAAFNLWEAVALFTPPRYPVWIEGRLYTREDFLASAYEALTGDAEASIEALNGDYVPAVLSILVDEVRRVGASDFGLSEERLRSLVAEGRKILES
jgi:hypothetical protein